MREMKDSGIEWIGEIPKGWETKKGKYVFCVSSGLAISKEEYVDNGEYPIIGSNGEIGRYNHYNNEKKVITTGRVGTVGTTHIVEKAWITDNALIVENNDLISQKFLSYCIPQFDYTQLLSGTAQPLITATKIKSQYLPYPSVEEQQKIADFLDDKCTEIDNLTADIQKQIDTLEQYKKSVITEAVTKGLNPDVEMKDSGVTLVGQIPKNWQVIKTGYLFKENVRKSYDDDIPLSLSQIDGLIATDDMKESSLKTASYDGWKKVLIDDLVLNRFKAHLGVMFAATLTGKVSFHYGVYEKKKDLVTKYYEYLFHTEPYKVIYAGLSNGMTVGLQNLSNQNFYIAKTLYPSLQEQKLIVKYLDEKCSEIDTIISDKKKQLETLEQYKKSLIYEYVTGKKEVPNE